MKQNKYKEALQNRVIDPPSDSWERLQVKLDSHKIEGNGQKWPFLKYAAAVLIFISVGFYFSNRNKEVLNDPTIVMPSPKKDLNKIDIITKDPEVEVAVSPGNSNIKKPDQTKQGTILSTIDEFGKEELALADDPNETGVSAIQVTQKSVHDSLSGTSLQIAALPSEEKALEDEVSRLLSQSKIKLSLKDTILSTKAVSAHSLLSDVEEDLDKALKEILLEKIAKTLKNPKEEVTFQEN